MKSDGPKLEINMFKHGQTLAVKKTFAYLYKYFNLYHQYMYLSKNLTYKERVYNAKRVIMRHP